MTWYVDLDDDGFGDAESTQKSCTQPAGFVADNNDCDDTDADINPQLTWYFDLDGDGFGDSSNSNNSCIQPNSFVDNDLDCDNADSDVNPQCNWFEDLDEDGFGNPDVSVVSCLQPVGHVKDNTDCDDTDNESNPGADEILDGIDNNCDGQVDEEMITGLSDELSDAISVYPSPVHDIVNVKLDNPSLFVNRIDLVSIHGNTLKSIESNESITTINLSDFRPGIYFVIISNDKESAVRRIIKH